MLFQKELPTQGTPRSDDHQPQQAERGLEPATAPQGGTRSILGIQDLRVVYGADSSAQVHALGDVSLEVQAGEFVSIVGPSGCGKTTMLEVVAGLRKQTSGSIVVDGAPLSREAAKRIGVVFQDDTLLPWRTVLGNAEFALEMRGVGKAERRAEARQLLKRVGLEDFEHRMCGELSGGMRQRLAVARTLATRPDILLLDEPFGALDAQTRLVVASEVTSIVHDVGSTVLLVTHSIEEAALLSDRVVVLTARPGRIKAVVPAGLERPRGMNWIGTPELAAIQAAIWDELRTEVQTATADQGEEMGAK